MNIAKKIISMIFFGLTLLLLVMLAVGSLGYYWWFFDLFSNFQLQYFIGFILLSSFFVLLRQRIFIVVSLTGIVITGMLIYGVYIGERTFGYSSFSNESEVSDLLTLRIEFMNISLAGDNLNLVVKEIENSSPDVLFITEITRPFYSELILQLNEYKNAHFTQGGGAFSMAVLSKHAFIDLEEVDLGDKDIKTLAIEIESKGRLICVIGTHPLPPVSRYGFNKRNEHMEKLAEYISGRDKEIVLVGDLNMTPYSPNFKRLINDSGLRDARKGMGVHGSWPATVPSIFRIPIDHTLVSKGIYVADRRLGGKIGSDHFPVILDINF